MLIKSKQLIWILLVSFILISGCAINKLNSNKQEIPNPAAVYYEEQGGTIEIRINPDGSQIG